MDLSQQQWAEQLAEDADAILIDVRTQEEVDEGYIPNARHIDLYNPQAFVTTIETLDKEKNYYIYCRSGNRSMQACAIMNQYGIANTYNLLGGFFDWKGDVVKSF